MPESLIPGSIVCLSSQAADRLIRLDNGDAALLYLHLLRTGTPSSLKWSSDRLQDALTLLQKEGLAPASFSLPEPAPAPDNSLPQYTQETINDALADPASHFSGLCDEVERMLGKRLSGTDLKELYRLYDYMNLPLEVILIVVSWCIEEEERKYGPGHRPRVSAIRREATAWAKRGISTVQQADEHIRRLSHLRDREEEVLRLLDLKPRPLVPSEKTYIAGWDDMGFDNQAIRMAYERCVAQKHELKWSYMNGILRRWHQKNLHTGQAILAAEGDPASRRGKDTPASAPARHWEPAPAPKEDPSAEEDMDQLQLLMERLQREEEEERKP